MSGTFVDEIEGSLLHPAILQTSVMRSAANSRSSANKGAINTSCRYCRQGSSRNQHSPFSTRHRRTHCIQHILSRILHPAHIIQHISPRNIIQHISRSTYHPATSTQHPAQIIQHRIFTTYQAAPNTQQTRHHAKNSTKSYLIDGTNAVVDTFRSRKAVWQT